MSKTIETLLIPVLGNMIPAKDKTCLFLNAQAHKDLARTGCSAIRMQQYWKTSAAKGMNPDLPPHTEAFDLVLVLLPKNIIEAQALLARGIMHVGTDGYIVCAADNDAGGARIKKMFQSFGLQDLHDESKHKARVVWARGEGADQIALDKALQAGEKQTIAAGQFTSIPGVFGWNKIDEGSALLASLLPETLHSTGADFGCGYGYLSDALLQKCKGVKTLFALDADFRAVELCTENLKKYGGNVTCRWEDITALETPLPPLDFIVMNPPFHEGKKTDIDLGLRFVQVAAQSLKKGGTLWMVANKHLPYEAILNGAFSNVSTISEKHGIKIFKAVK